MDIMPLQEILDQQGKAVMASLANLIMESCDCTIYVA